jgi:hypothetical protein
MRHDTANTRRVPVFETLLVILVLLLAAARAQAAFQIPQVGARSAAMSGASVPAQPDSTSIFQNAAGVSGLERGEAYMMYDKLYAGQTGVDSIGQSFIAGGAPTRWGAVSVGLSDFKAAGLLDERVLGVGFSRPLSKNLDAGVTLKYLYHKYAPGSDQSGIGDPVFAHGTSRGAAAFDAGLIATLSRNVKAAFAVRNINSPDVGLDSEDRVPREYQAGLSYDAPGWLLKTTADVVYRDNHVGTLRDRATPSIGFEKGFADAPVKFRVGAGPDQFSAGVGFQFDRFGFDYAFILTRNLISSSAGSHVIAVRYRFGGAAAATKGTN